jgi:hypothetical protein
MLWFYYHKYINCHKRAAIIHKCLGVTVDLIPGVEDLYCMSARATAYKLTRLIYF